MNEHPPNDLDWQAFRYIAAEMSPAEMAEFEGRLADDQRAREAVSRATELADAVAIASAEFPVSSPSELTRPGGPVRAAWQSRLLWGAVGAAAALAGVFLCRALPFPSTGSHQDGRLSGMTRDAAAELKEAEFALLWCRTRNEMAESEGDLWPSDLPADSLNAEENDSGLEDQSVAAGARTDLAPDQPEDTAESEEILPSWMLVAVAGELDAVGGNGDLPLEN